MATSPDPVADLYRDLRRMLLEAGRVFVRPGKEDHEIWFTPLADRTFSVDRSIRSRHKANAVLRDAGLKKAF